MCQMEYSWLVLVCSFLSRSDWSWVSCLGWQLFSRTALCGRTYLEELTRSVCKVCVVGVFVCAQ